MNPGHEPVTASARESVLAAHGAWLRHDDASHQVGPLDLTLAHGEWVLLLGPSGSGKSSLLRLLQGAIPQVIDADCGGVVHHGGARTDEIPLAAVAAHCGFVAQDPRTGVCLGEVAEEVAFPLENLAWTRPAMAERVLDTLQTVGAAHLKGRATHTLSGGELQRVAVAAALAPRVPLLLLDEPTAMLDGQGIEHVQAALEAARSTGVAGVLVEHRLDEWVARGGLASLPERWIALDANGQVILDGPAAHFSDAEVTRLAALGCWLPGEWEDRVVPQAAVPAEPEPANPEPANPEPANSPSLAIPQGPPLTAENLGLRHGGGLPRKPHRFTRRRANPANLGRAADPATLASDLNLAVARGECVALVGANGTGKSTLLAALAGLAPPAAGRVTGGPASLVFQHPEVQFVGHTVLADLRAGLPGIRDAEVHAMLQRFGLEHAAERHPLSLSGGEQRRLSVAAMLLHDRPFLLADEPTFGLDRAAAAAILAALRDESRAGRGVLFTTHDARAVLGYADRVIVLGRDDVGVTRVRADTDTLRFALDHALVAAAGMTIAPHLAGLAAISPDATTLGWDLRRRDAALGALAPSAPKAVAPSAAATHAQEATAC